MKLVELPGITRLILHAFIDSVAVGLSKAPQHGQLILVALTFILGRDTGIEINEYHASNVLQ
jgi:hypothetical protein